MTLSLQYFCQHADVRRERIPPEGEDEEKLVEVGIKREGEGGEVRGRDATPALQPPALISRQSLQPGSALVCSPHLSFNNHHTSCSSSPRLWLPSVHIQSIRCQFNVSGCRPAAGSCCCYALIVWSCEGKMPVQSHPVEVSLMWLGLFFFIFFLRGGCSEMCHNANMLWSEFFTWSSHKQLPKSVEKCLTRNCFSTFCAYKARRRGEWREYTKVIMSPHFSDENLIWNCPDFSYKDENGPQNVFS